MGWVFGDFDNWIGFGDIDVNVNGVIGGVYGGYNF